MSIQQNSKFNAEQYATILNFLEDPQNKAKIFGVSGKTEVGMAPPRKIEAWKELAALINSKFRGKYKVDHKSVADRWRTYFNKYKVARERSSTTGFGVTDEDKRKNIHTVQAKLEMMCPHYERIHALLGERPNVNPAATFDSGLISPETDLNELLRFNSEDVPGIPEEDPLIATVDSLGTHDSIDIPNGIGVAPQPIVGSNDEFIFSPPSEHNQATQGPQPEDDDIFNTEVDTSSVPAPAATKRPAMLDINEPKRSKRDRRKELPSISGIKNPTNARNHLAQTIQDCASAKAAALVSIEEKRLKFEQMKWETEQEVIERRRQEDKEDASIRRAEEKAEKERERRFALLQTMIADHKSPEEIKEILSMLL